MKQALADALQKREYTTLTPVQEAVTQPEHIGADLLVSAQTGSGKTIGFGLAIAPTILDEEKFERAGAPLALVVAPTRELALQVKRELSWLYAEAGVVMASCVGGMDMRDERRALERGAHIVVATPGRLRDHIMRGSIDLSQIRSIVLDEADEMLDLGFRDDLEFILAEAPEERQTLLFSATVSKSIAQLATSYQRDAIRVVTKAKGDQHADITYQAMMVSDRQVENAVVNTLRFYEAPNAIVFANTRAAVNRLTSRLSNRGFQVVALSGELTQSERSNALQAMRDGRARICIATDVAARGIDLPNLDLVVHAELPGSHETLLHRSGRTGRAGRKGVSALIVTHKTRRKAERILKMAKLSAEWTVPPSADAVLERDQERLMQDSSWHDPATDAETSAIAKLTEAFTPEQLALGFLRLYRTQHTAPEEITDAAPAKPKERAPFGPSVWFRYEAGRNDHVDPRRLLPMICEAGGVTKDAIGAIRIQQDQAFFEISETAIDGFIGSVGDGMQIEGTEIVRLETAPDLSQFKRGPKPGGKRPYRKPDSGPIDWNDDPKPRNRKPKPADRKGPGKPGGKPAGKFGGKPGGKPAGKPGGKPGGKFGGKPAGNPHRADKSDGAGAARPDGPSKGKFAKSGKPKGPPPPQGKPNSKKNQARAKAQGGFDTPRGRK